MCQNLSLSKERKRQQKELLFSMLVQKKGNVRTKQAGATSQEPNLPLPYLRFLDSRTVRK